MFAAVAGYSSKLGGGLKPAAEVLKVNNTAYVKGRLLGSGAFGAVYEATDSSGNVFACKVMEKAKFSAKNHIKMRAEMKIHRGINHRHIVKMHQDYEDTHYVYLVLELCPNETVADMLKRRKTLQEVEVRLFMAQVVSALMYLHDNNIVHRDLKPGNILLDANMDVKICDLGLAATVNAGHQRRTFCGTPNFISPEVLDKVGHGFEVDIWAIGVIMYTLIIGTPPFQSKDKDETIKLISDPHFKYHVPDSVPQHARQVFDSALQRDRTLRPSAEKILDFAFFTDGMVPSKVPIEALHRDPKYTPDMLVPFTSMAPRLAMRDSTNSVDPSRPSLNKAMAARAVRQRRPLLQNANNAAQENNQENQPAPATATLAPAPTTTVAHAHIQKPRRVVPESSAAPPVASHIAPPVQPVRAAVPTAQSSVPVSQPANQWQPARAAPVANQAQEKDEGVFKRPLPVAQPVRQMQSQQQKGVTSLPVRKTVQAVPPQAPAPTAAPTQAPPTAPVPAPAPAHRTQTATEPTPLPVSAPVNTLRALPTTAPAPAPVPAPAPSTVQPEAVFVGGDRMDKVFERKNYQHAERQEPRQEYLVVEHDGEAAAHAMLVQAGRLLEQTAAQRSDTLQPDRPMAILDPPPLLWVSRWLDYSYKYGLSYQLSDGTVGVVFVDNTQIVLSPQRDVVEYTDEKQQLVVAATNSPPEGVAKKFKLLDHFRQYMSENLLMGGVGIPAVDAANRERARNFVRVYEWARSETAMVFHLTNGVLQLNFFDHAKIVVSVTNHLVTFIPIEAPCQTYRLADITRENYPELHARLRHLRSHVGHLLQRNKNEAQAH